MSVSARVIERKGTQNQAITALLHDVIEDCGITKSQIADEFGERISEMVSDCTDSFSKEEKDRIGWKQRKKNFIDRIPHVHFESLLVIACDKWHNVGQLNYDLDRYGTKIWGAFEGAPPAILGYHESLMAAVKLRDQERSSSENELGLALRDWRNVLEVFKNNISTLHK